MHEEEVEVDKAVVDMKVRTSGLQVQQGEDAQALFDAMSAVCKIMEKSL